ncbi:DUF3426 domain-containing protein [Methylomonas sp. LL1]|uniref:zinc-ribbon and DUF3426 domain-containing protein n=1 Tax=Methylomonas sp. LL1 TaxID=2785785 RepID=UPI0018C4470C|nr:zinc-ribbon and DUF3426 domain-containing protein [Methylomonas sp. LL1]QPK65610.1 DUF3426 domain-containing protein [Methylomonas sp. LL1]
MFSRCPHCDAQQAVTTRQLRDSRGLLSCTGCGQTFDALPSLSEQADEAPVRHDSIELPSQKSYTTESGWRWRLASLAALLVLLGQVVYFEGERLNRQPRIHAALTKVCQTLGCRAPAYENPDAWSLSHTDLQPHLDRRYLLTAALTNQAEFAQAFPQLKLALTDFNGRPLAQRVFTPCQYAADAELGPNQTAQIHLPIILSAEVGGFSLTLLNL